MSNKQKIEMVNTDCPLSSDYIPSFESGLVDKKGTLSLFAYGLWKGIFDRVLALLAILVLSPFLAIIAVAIKIDSPGSSIFRREQVGENGRMFTAYKFRTMYINNDDKEYKTYLVKYVLENAPYTVDHNGQAVYKVVDDPRVTRVGALLRKTNLDELPQFINVLKGEMSAIGPRPDVPFAVRMYKNWHRERLLVKPGITGLWQVCGRKQLSFDDMARLDIDYIKKRSLLLDVRIFFLTIGTLLKMDGS